MYWFRRFLLLFPWNIRGGAGKSLLNFSAPLRLCGEGAFRQPFYF